MKRITFVLPGVILLLAASSLVSAQTPSSDEAGVRACIEHYFRGHATGSGEHFRRAFHPDAKLFFMREGQLTQWTLEEYAGRASGKPAADETQRKRRIESMTSREMQQSPKWCSNIRR